MYVHIYIYTYSNYIATYVCKVCICASLFSDDDKYCRIVHVSIIVLGIYTFGTTLLLWWLYKKLVKCCFSGDVKDDPKGRICTFIFACIYNMLINRLTKAEISMYVLLPSEIRPLCDQAISLNQPTTKWPITY